MRSRSAAGFRFIPTLTAPRTPFAGTISIHAHLYARSTFIFPYLPLLRGREPRPRNFSISRNKSRRSRSRLAARIFSLFFLLFSLSLSLSLFFFVAIPSRVRLGIRFERSFRDFIAESVATR